MSDFRLNLKFRGNHIGQQVTKSNNNIINQKILPNNSKFANIKSVLDFTRLPWQSVSN